MFDRSHTDILRGCHFTIGTRYGSYVYRSYIFQGRTFIKFVRANGLEVHLGRYSYTGIHFNKKYRNVRDTPRNRHIRSLTILSDFLQGGQVPVGMTYAKIDGEDLTEAQEATIESQDDQDYFYRIGYA
jgi:hypothetical protein